LLYIIVDRHLELPVIEDMGVKSVFRAAIQELNVRGLRLASQFLCEQLLGLPETEEPLAGTQDDMSAADTSHEIPGLNSSRGLAASVQNLSPQEYDLAMFAGTLIGGGEFQRCAHLLRRKLGTCTHNPPNPIIRTSGMVDDGRNGSALNTSMGSMSSQPNTSANPDSNSTVAASPLLVFLSNYALYMAGEKLRQQQAAEKKGSKGHPSPESIEQAEGKYGAKNPFLGDILTDLLPLYLADPSFHRYMSLSSSTSQTPKSRSLPLSTTAYPKGTSMDAFLLYIFGVAVRDFRRQGGSFSSLTLEMLPPATELLIESARRYPSNWSCWLELVRTCVTEKCTPPDWRRSDELTEDKTRARGGTNEGVGLEEGGEGLQIDPSSPGQGDNHMRSATESQEGLLMYQFFLSEYYLQIHRGEAAMDSLSLLEENFPKSLSVGASIALAQYSLRDLDAAQDTFEALREEDPHRLSHLDTYSNILYVKEKRAELSHLAHMTSKVSKFKPETCCIVGNYYSLIGKHERAITYFQRALRLAPDFLSAWTLMGHEYVELHNTAAAVSCYREAISVSDSDFRAWYGLGQTYEMLHLYQYALYYFRKATALRPSDPRMWSAVASCLSRLGNTLDAIGAYERAADCNDTEGIAVRELARLHKSTGNTTGAARYFETYLASAGIRPSIAGSEHAMIINNTMETRLNDSNMHSNPPTPPSTIGVGASLGRDREGGGNSVKDWNTLNIEPRLSAVMAAPGLDDPLVDLDADRAEAALFLAWHYREKGSEGLDHATFYASLLLDYNGPESHEAKTLLREIRSFEHQTRTSSNGTEIRTGAHTDSQVQVQMHSNSESRGRNSGGRFNGRGLYEDYTSVGNQVMLESNSDEEDMGRMAGTLDDSNDSQDF